MENRLLVENGRKHKFAAALILLGVAVVCVVTYKVGPSAGANDAVEMFVVQRRGTTPSATTPNSSPNDAVTNLLDNNDNPRQDASPCYQRWISGCHKDWAKGGALLDVNVEDAEKCRAQCNLIDGCGFFAFSQQREGKRATCTAFSTPFAEFLGDCMEGGGEVFDDADFDRCAMTEPKEMCDFYRYGDCKFSGTFTENFEVPSEKHCIGIAAETGKKGAVYTKENKKCKVYDMVNGWKETCASVYGPPSNTPEECSFADKPMISPHFYLPYTYSTKNEISEQGDSDSFGYCSTAAFPIESAYFPEQGGCQVFCKIHKNCKFYAFDSNSVSGMNCHLYDADLSNTLSNCDSIGGTGEAPPNLSPEHGPEMLTDAECTHPGVVIEHYSLAADDDVNLPGKCAEFCKGYDGCKYWVFSKHDATCRLLDSALRRCSMHYGGGYDEQPVVENLYPPPCDLTGCHTGSLGHQGYAYEFCIAKALFSCCAKLGERPVKMCCDEFAFTAHSGLPTHIDECVRFGFPTLTPTPGPTYGS